MHKDQIINRKNTSTYRLFAMLFAATIIFVLSTAFASARIELDGVSSDPSVIAAGDEVVLSVNFHDSGQQRYDAVNDGSMTLKATLEAGDTVSERYVTILDGNGDRSIGHLFYGQVWTKNYRVRFSSEAPTGTYQFRLVFQYLEDGEPSDAPIIEYFTVTVGKEGIIMNIANVVTSPAEIRPGDNYITLTTQLENSGRKDAKAVELLLETPEGFRVPYADNNRVWAGYIAAGEKQDLTLHFSLAESVQPGVHDVLTHLTYSDVDDNRYEKSITIPLRVREKPILTIVNSEGSVAAGGSGEFRVTVRNEGSERAENVDVRIIAQSDQPFDLEARSEYIGMLNPGEEGVAVFPVNVRSGASVKTHSITAVIRAKGDSDLGDTNIYTFNDEAEVIVTGKEPNRYLLVGIGLLAVVLLLAVVQIVASKKRRRK